MKPSIFHPSLSCLYSLRQSAQDEQANAGLRNNHLPMVIRGQEKQIRGDSTNRRSQT